MTVARYLEDDMELQEKTAFEALLQTDPELQELIAEYKNIHQTLKIKIAPSEADRQVAETLSSLTKQYFKTESKEGPLTQVVSLKPYLKWISIAAVLVIGLLVWAPWSANLYQKYTISKEMSVAERGDTGKNNLEKAAEFYNNGDFAAASKILQKEYALAPENSMAAYYYGITLTETGKTAEARAVLTKLYAGESVFKQDAAYCIALTYLKEKSNRQAMEWLSKIPEGTANYEKAIQLIRKLQ